MSKTSMWCLVGLLSLWGAAQSVAQGTRSTEEIIIRMEERWWDAQLKCNPDQVASLLSDRAVITQSDGKVFNKSDELAACKSTKWSVVRFFNTDLAVFGDTVIATGDFEGKGTNASGKRLDVHARWTRTWVRMPNSQWQCVASNASPVGT
jgi:ketosteroid isomerase-like protein